MDRPCANIVQMEKMFPSSLCKSLPYVMCYIASCHSKLNKYIALWEIVAGFQFAHPIFQHWCFKYNGHLHQLLLYNVQLQN